MFTIILKISQGRLIYCGAGTSGRVAKDAVELYPTFGWPNERIGFMIVEERNLLQVLLKVQRITLMKQKNFQF